jgi:hypothetical protein
MNAIRLLMLMLTMLTVGLLGPATAAATSDDTNLLTNVPVSGALADGGTVDGTLTITEFGYTEATGLTVSGTLTGVATRADGSTTEVDQRFATVPATLNESSAAAGDPRTEPARCAIVVFDPGPLTLELLDVTIDLPPIVLNTSAIPGAATALGTALCKLAALLDLSGRLAGQWANLQAILAVINFLLR